MGEISSRTGLEAVSSVLTVDVTFVGAAVVVRVQGDVDMMTKDRLDERLRAVEAAVEPPAAVVLDLSGVRFLASMGLALLIDHHERCERRGTPLRVVVTNNQVRRPIELTGLNQVLAIVESVDAALNA
jgi:anti-sigma B factor antagonist